jgi:hypothetical protein
MVVTNILEELVTSIFNVEITLKMEAAGFSETLMSFYHTMSCHIPEHTVLQLPQSSFESLPASAPMATSHIWIRSGMGETWPAILTQLVLGSMLILQSIPVPCVYSVMYIIGNL